MKKIFKVLIVLLVAMSVIGCSSTVKTTVANQEEWEAVMEPSKYVNGKTTVTLLSNEEVNMSSIYYGSEDIAKVIDEIEGRSLDYFYINEEDSLRIKYVYDDGNDIYTTGYYEYDSVDEQKESWKFILESMLAPSVEGIENFADGTYDSKNKCYHFSIELYDEYPGEIDVYIENGYVVKEISTIVFDEEEPIVTEYLFEPTYNEEIKYPDIKNTVNNEEEWKSLFDIDKYSNCYSCTEYDGIEILNYITSDAIEQSVYINDYESAVYRMITRVDDTKEKVVEEDEDGNSTEYEIEFDETLTCFEDNFVMLTYNYDLSDKYNEVELVDDHYEYKYVDETTNGLIKIYISNGHITRVDVSNEYIDGSTFESHTDIENFGTVSIY